MALVYLVVVIAYGVLIVIHRKVVLEIQYGIWGVVIWSCIECAAWYFYRLGNNKTGNYSLVALILVVLMANIKKTLTRVMVLLVSMGIGKNNLT